MRNSRILKSCAAAKRRNPRARAFTYTISLKGGKKYVGYTRNPIARMKAHMSGNGARVTRYNKPTSVKFTAHRSVAAARRAETKQYYAVKRSFGAARVRGAGNTARF